MIIPPVLTTSLTHISLKAWENLLLELGTERVKPGCGPRPNPPPPPPPLQAHKHLIRMIVAFFLTLQVLVVLTSGRQTTNKGPYTPLHAASQGLKDRGVHIYVIGIGNDVAVPELMDVSSTFRDVFLVHEASTLLSRALVVRDVVRNSTAELTNSE